MTRFGTRLETKRVDIGNVIRSAVVFDLKNWQGAAANADSLLQSVARLFALLSERQIDYALVGGVAMLRYVEGRNTDRRSCTHFGRHCNRCCTNWPTISATPIWRPFGTSLPRFSNELTDSERV